MASKGSWTIGSFLKCAGFLVGFLTLVLPCLGIVGVISTNENLTGEQRQGVVHEFFMGGMAAAVALFVLGYSLDRRAASYADANLADDVSSALGPGEQALGNVRCPSCNVVIAAKDEIPTKCEWCKKDLPPATRQRLNASQRKAT